MELLPLFSFRSLHSPRRVRRTWRQGPSRHTQFSAGEPGDPKKPARIVEVIDARDATERWSIVPDRIEVKRNEQIRFMIRNSG